jgi:hypothetical protein
MPQCANCVKASKLADVPAVQSDFMEFLQRLSATWMPAAPRVLAPKITCPDSKQLFQMMNFGIQKGVILLFWIIVAKQGLGWSGWNGSGPMKLHKIYEATTVADPFFILIILAAAAKRSRIIIHLIDLCVCPVVQLAEVEQHSFACSRLL